MGQSLKPSLAQQEDMLRAVDDAGRIRMLESLALARLVAVVDGGRCGCSGEIPLGEGFHLKPHPHYRSRCPTLGRLHHRHPSTLQAPQVHHRHPHPCRSSYSHPHPTFLPCSPCAQHTLHPRASAEQEHRPLRTGVRNGCIRAASRPCAVLNASSDHVVSETAPGRCCTGKASHGRV